MNPIHATSFIGRENDIAAICDLLRSGACRLLTIPGSGGTGKTRLAGQLSRTLANDFEAGVVFVDLQPVQQPDGMITALLDALDVPLSGSANSRDILFAALRDRHQLLILDNFEHLIGGVTLLPEMLVAAPQLHVLVTSREALRLKEEYLYRLRGLAVPADNISDGLDGFHAVRLFLERAQQVRHTIQPDLPTVAAICRLVDGNPLAIEMAAVWTQVLPVEDIYREIQHCLAFLQTDRRNVPERHRSIRAVFDGSWNLLNADEQKILLYLAFFPQSFIRDAANQIAGATLTHLVRLQDKSLLTMSAEGHYRMHPLVVLQKMSD